MQNYPVFDCLLATFLRNLLAESFFALNSIAGPGLSSDYAAKCVSRFELVGQTLHG